MCRVGCRQQDCAAVLVACICAHVGEASSLTSCTQSLACNLLPTPSVVLLLDQQWPPRQLPTHLPLAEFEAHCCHSCSLFPCRSSIGRSSDSCSCGTLFSTSKFVGNFDRTQSSRIDVLVDGTHWETDIISVGAPSKPTDQHLLTMSSREDVCSAWRQRSLSGHLKVVTVTL